MVSGPAVASDSDDHISRQDSPPTFFVKDRRKIHVGDCALFQADHAPPSIGIIRWFSTCTDNKLKLGVNWLYRPADIKLGEGISVDAAPNEVFYSFNREEIPAASLLHPCKVVFLCKDVELPSGLSSFVCRRVYDNENKRLSWLTDQDYNNDRQKEVNQLLDRTRLEMHALQIGGRSPKTLNASVSSQQLKSGSDDGQTSGTSVTEPVKGKKRERSEQGVDPIKRERRGKVDDVCSGKVDSLIKAEILKITGKGELVSTEGVDRLVCLMQRDRSDRKLDTASKVVVADLIAGTKRFDCLNRFVQLRGIPILDNWLQEAHKGRTGDGSSPEEDDKSTEELLLALLRALDKLPVNLNALQACNIGKSVNHLRAHKNQEIQKKARSLVDTWKKRVDAEMDKINDATSVSSASWASRPGFHEVSCGVIRRAGSAANILSSTSKAVISSNPGNSDIVTKAPQVTPGKMKASVLSSSIVSSKDADKVRGCDHLMIGNSNQSQNNSQSCSSSHVKKISSPLKDDAKSSFAGSTNTTSKMTSGSSRHRRSKNGFVAATSQTGISGEANIGKPSTRSKMTAVADHRNSRRLIVRIPNHGRSPIRSGGGGSSGDPDKFYRNDLKMKLRKEASGAADVNTESWLSNDVKERLVSSDETERSHGSAINDECCKSPDEAGKAIDSSKTACSSSASGKEIILAESKKVLIESCDSYAEARVSLIAGDDAGMNLLASVAAGEMSRSSLASPGESPMNSADASNPRQGDDGEKVGYSPDLIVVQSESNRNLKEENLAGEVSELQPISTTTFQNQAFSVESKGVNKEDEVNRSVPSSTSGENIHEFVEGDEISQLSSRVNANEEKSDSFSDFKHQVTGRSSDESDGSNGYNSSKIHIRRENVTDNEPNACTEIEKRVPSAMADAEGAVIEDGCRRCDAENSTPMEIANSKEGRNSPEMPSHLETSDKKKNDSVSHSTADNQGSETKDSTQSAGELKNRPNSSMSMSLASEKKKGLTSSAAPDASKLDFDLNEGIPGEPVILAAATPSPTSHFDAPFRMSNLLRTPITVAVPAKGHFVPPVCLLKNNVKAGWKGSAATSAFRPARSRKGSEMQLDAPDFPSPYTMSRKRDRLALDIDLNVPDDSALDDIASQNSAQTLGSESGAISNYNTSMRSSGGLDLDLNKVDERTENGQFSASFDLNGPGLDVVVSEPSLRGPHAKIRTNNSDFGNMSAWLSPGSLYSAITFPSLPDRTGQPYSVIPTTGAQRVFGPVTGGSTFGGDIYRSSAISSSTAFPYSGYPYGSSFPLASTVASSSLGAGPCFANMPSQVVGPTGAVSLPFSRPFVVSVPESNASVGKGGSRKLDKHGLDLNAGPGF